MKKLSIIAILVLMVASAVSAHDGSLGIYTSALATDCDATLAPFSPFDVYIMYIRSDGGPDGITGAEFMAEFSNPGVVVTGVAWDPSILDNGGLTTGIALVFQGVACFMPGETMIHIGTVTLMNTGAPAGWTMKIVGDPRSITGNGLNVSICDETKSMVPVLGGWFLGEDGTCNPGSESTTWGAVKSIYNN